jgi:hypothetical protein
MVGRRMSAQTDDFAARTSRASRTLDGIGAANAEHIANVIRALTKYGATCTSDDVYPLLAEPARQCLTVHPNAVPACFTNLQHAGEIETTGDYIASARKEARGRRIQVWRAAA